MKKTLVLFLVLVTVTAMILIGCSAGTPAAIETESVAPVSEPAAPVSESAAPVSGDGFVIGFSNYNNEISWRTQMEAEFTYAADQYKAQGVLSDYKVLEANGDQAKQISDIQDLITMGVDAIVLPAITSDGLNDVLQEAMDEGILVINFDNNCSASVSCKITVSDYNHGYVSGTWLGQQLKDAGKDAGNVIILRGGAGTSTDSNRYQGGYDGLFELCPDVKVIAEEHCDWDYATTKTTIETLLATYPEIDGVLSQGGAMTQAAIDAFNESGRELCPMTGEAGNGFLKAWIDNSDKGFESMAFNNPAYSSKIAIDCAVALLQGKTIDDCVSLISSDYGIEPKVSSDDSNAINLAFDPVTLDQAKELYDSTLNDDFWPGSYLPHDVLENIFPVG